ncbi:TonB-dependent receptor [Niabella sp. CC-SYL272]|uniref:SusC/RagA family TonB-linked outer membrane protein n=1 Tax=Niabella agricola TaxID=2891571 RepID=UPI001F48B4AF|nr:TonB-dependent receptor [Niabella agricola]MCF3110816.1 TonB-dependent receptor [Niabella agricola]
MRCLKQGLLSLLTTKVFLAMKLTVFFLLFFTLNIYADGFGQQRINLRVKKTELAEVLRSIEEKTSYRFLYNNDLPALKSKVTFNAKEATIEEVLPVLLFYTDMTFQQMENNLIVIREDPSAKKAITVTGTVTDSSGVPISGVSVLIKGTNIGTVTNEQGKFTLSVPDAKSILVFSAVGFEEQEYPLNGGTQVTISLKSSQQVMDQVVVIGYGTAAKRDLTGSIAKIDGRDIADKPNTNPIASLQGKVAGLSVVNNGTPGQAPDIRIRGTASIGQVKPLYVVDGIFQDNIDYLNPNDIESIEILKDPSSLAIFGVKGATGVIAVTTKRAKSGQVVVNFNTSYGFKTLVDKIRMANAQQFAELYAEELRYAGNTTIPPVIGNANTDWIDAVTRVGKMSINNISISAATERNKLNLGVGYIYDEGIIKHQQLSRFNINFSDEFKINQHIKLGVNLIASRQNNPYDVGSSNTAGGVLDDARKVVPQIPSGTQRVKVRDLYGTPTDSIYQDLYYALDPSLQTAGVVNPLLKLENEWDKVKNIEYRTVGSFFVDINITKDLNWRSTVYADISNVNKRQYTPAYYAYSPVFDSAILYSPTTKVKENDDTYRKFQQDHILTYKKRFGAHNLTATGGFTTYYFGFFGREGNASQSTKIGAKPIPDNSRFWYINNGFQDPLATTATSTQNEYTTVSGLARLLYNYQNKYYFNTSYRRDASSRLYRSVPAQSFWALGAAWEISKEDFFSNLKDHVNFLKLKGSLGVLGNQSAYNQNTGTQLDYPLFPLLANGQTAVFGTNVYTAADEVYFPNPNLKWEQVHSHEIGIEGAALRNRLNFEVNYFSKTTKDLMTFIDNSALGLKSALLNAGSLKNWGTEISAGYNSEIAKDFTVNVSGNITFLKNKVLSLSKDLPSGKVIRGFTNNNAAQSITQVGYPIGYFYGYVVEGLYQSWTDVITSPDASGVGGSYGPGDFKFKDVNGDGVITPDDRTIIGNPTPDFTYGGNLTLSYKGISLGVDIGGVYGNEVFRTWASLESPFQRVNYAEMQTARWHGEGTSNWTPILGQAHRFNYNGSTYNIEDGSYVRIRNLQLSYSLSQKLVSKIGFRNLKIFANVQNLKTWKHNSGYSPEYGGDATAFGFDFGGNAIPRVTSFGLNATF